MGCGGSKEDSAMIEAIGREPKEPIPTGDAMRDALAKKKYQVELRAYRKRLENYKAEAAERKNGTQSGFPPKAEAQVETVVDKAEEAAKKAAKEAARKKEAEAAAERRRLRDEERRKNDPILLKAAKDKKARDEAKKQRAAEEEARAWELEEQRVREEEKQQLKEIEALEEEERAAAAKALEEEAAKKLAQEEARKAAEEPQTVPAEQPAKSKITPQPAPTPTTTPISEFGYTDPTGRWVQFVEPSGLWDDGIRCVNQPGGLVLHCSWCGHRPRPEHEFRCRLHDAELSNGAERPTFPANVHDKMAMRRYAKDMDEWQPSWLDREDEDESLTLDADETYPLHCPGCDGKTKQHGATGVRFATSLDVITDATKWLPSHYAMSVNAPVPATQRRFFVDTGMWGHCIKCHLLVQATVEEEDKKG